MIDLILLRTFLELNRTRHFGKAAENLYITQSTMSARIRQLEELLGVTLFTRERNNIQLTASGEKLIHHAEGLLSAWNRARMDVALPQEQTEFLAIAAHHNLWDSFLQQWLHTVYQQMPELGLRAEGMKADEIRRALLENRLDLGFVFEPVHHDEFTLHELLSIDLMLFSTRRESTPEQALEMNYIFVEWGAAFAIQHARAFPSAPLPRLHISTGHNALACLLECGGAAYLARDMVEQYLQEERLFVVEGAPTIKRPCYATYRTSSEKAELIEHTLSLV